MLNAPVVLPPRARARPRALTVLPNGKPARQGLPDECPTEAICPYVECPMHLLHVEPCDRGKGQAADKCTACGQRGHNRRTCGQEHAVEAKRRSTCALDYSDREHTAAEVGALMSMSKRRVQQVIKDALEKLGIDDDAARAWQEANEPDVCQARPAPRRSHGALSGDARAGR